MVQAAARAVGAHRGDDVGPDRADEADEVARDLVLAPLLERLVDAERVAEVDRAREVLLGAVEAVQREQLFGAQDAERFEQLGTDLVLAAVAARRRHERGPVAESPIRLDEQSVVLVVGMRRRHHQDPGVGEMPQHEAERDVPLLVVERDDPHLGVGGEGEENESGADEGGPAEECGHGSAHHEGTKGHEDHEFLLWIFAPSWPS